MVFGEKAMNTPPSCTQKGPSLGSLPHTFVESRHARVDAQADSASSSSFFTWASEKRCMSFGDEVDVGVVVEGSTWIWWD